MARSTAFLFFLLAGCGVSPELEPEVPSTPTDDGVETVSYTHLTLPTIYSV